MSPVRVCVTGSEGFVGAAVVRALIEQHPEYHIIRLDIRQTPADKPEFIKADVRKYNQVSKALLEVKPDLVIHTAGIVPKGAFRYNHNGREAIHEVNVKGTANVLEASKASGVKAVVYISTVCVITDDHHHDYPNYDETVPYPKSSLTYGETKAEAEQLVLTANGKGLVTCALRPPVIFGEDDYQLIPTVHACITKGETSFMIGTGDNLYDFVYVGNVADAIIHAVENMLSTQTAAGEAISISNGEPLSFRDFCLAVWGACGHRPPFTVKIPASIAWFAGWLSECYTWFTGTASTLSRGSVNDALGTRYADIGKARTILKYEPRVGLAEGVQRSVKAYLQRLQTQEETMAGKKQA